jgi:hypothetical protein
MLLFLCVVCVLKWLDFQPKIAAMLGRPLNTEQVLKLTTIQKHEKYVCAAMLTALATSIFFLIAHILLFATYPLG